MTVDEFFTRSSSYILCTSCRELGRCRLGITGEELLGEGRSLIRAMCPADNAGGPEVAHGGWTAAVLDEMLGHLPLLAGRFTVTAKLSVEYLRPVPVERALEGYAWVEAREEGRWKTAGELKLAAGGALLARATGLYVERDRGHFERYRQWLSEQDAERRP